MKLSIIVIPVFKTIPDWNEKISFNQCLKILFKHPMCIITYKDLDISYYIDLFVKAQIKYTVKYFDKSYYESLPAYNQLMLSINFYEKFKSYDYMLIYQLDAYVFRDELEYWCEQGYDYIGAPWFDDESRKSHNLINPKFIGVGNGGFSLRKIKSQLKVLNSLCYIVPVKSLIKGYLLKCKNQSVRSILIDTTNLLKDLTIKNNTFYIFNNYIDNEDVFWGEFCKSKFTWYSIPTFETAFKFSFEILPEYLYKMNNNKLAFGCHRWHIEPYLSFWNKHIETASQTKDTL